MLEKGNIPNHNNKCRLCMSSVEDIGHILAGCPQMSSRFYLPLRHDEVANTFLYSHIKKYSPANSSPVHLVAIRGRRKRGPGTLQTRDQNLPKKRAYFFRINDGTRGWQH